MPAPRGTSHSGPGGIRWWSHRGPSEVGRDGGGPRGAGGGLRWRHDWVVCPRVSILVDRGSHGLEGMQQGRGVRSMFSSLADDSLRGSRQEVRVIEPFVGLTTDVAALLFTLASLFGAPLGARVQGAMVVVTSGRRSGKGTHGCAWIEEAEGVHIGGIFGESGRFGRSWE